MCYLWSLSSEILAEKDRYGLKCTTKICCDCGFVYTSPRMTQDSYTDFYDSEYSRLYVGVETPGSVFFNDQKYRGERILKYINSNIDIAKKPFDVLEVGCGAGGILQSFRSAGHVVLGLDLGEEYLNYGIENFGLNLKKGGLADLDKEYKADIIIYSHVLEHILDIDKELGLIKSHLKKDGFVYIEVPGLMFVHQTYDMNFLKYLQNAHTYHFTLNSLTRMFSNNGFELISGDEQIRSLFKLTSQEKSNDFRNEYLTVKKYIERNENRRILNFLKFRSLRWNIKKLVLSLNAINKK